MTEPLTLMIVEDEALLAECAQNISAIFTALSRYGWRSVWRRRMMIDRVPRARINSVGCYLPDGKGITLLHELMRSRCRRRRVYDRRQ